MSARRLALGFAIAVACWRASSTALAEAPNFANVLSAVTVDFAGDGRQDRAVLVQNGDAAADLYIYLAKDDSKFRTGLDARLAQKERGLQRRHVGPASFA